MKKAHFIGIGGIGVSAVAQLLASKGYNVTGTNLEQTEIIDILRKKGADVFVGKHEDYVDKLEKNKPDIVVYTPAVKSNNPELKKAKEMGIECLSAPELIGRLSQEYFVIAISGTHGKSTTTSMLSVAMINLGLDPTVIVGTKLKEFGDSNFRLGKSDYLVIEADEYKSSFLNYNPKIVICTNIEADHLDYFKTQANIVKNFKKFVSKIPKDGLLIASKDDNVVKKLGAKKSDFEIIEYSLKDKEAKKIAPYVQIPGDHNILNAMAVAHVCRRLKAKESKIYSAIKKYSGAWRRFEVYTEKIPTRRGMKKITCVSDYGHHPTEVLKTLEAARKQFKKEEIIVFVQPHQYQRTLTFKKDFVKAYKEAEKKKYFDKLFITDIYDVKGRESEDISKKISAEILAKAVKSDKVGYIEKTKIKDWLRDNITGKEIILILSAGDFYRIEHGQ